MEGERRRMQMAAGQQMQEQAAGGNHLRTAIGAYRGSTIKRFVLVTLVGGALFGALGVTLSALGEGEIGQFFMPGFGVAFVCIFVVAFVPPLASRGAVAAEQDWLMALPFPLTGYFEVLSRQPTYGRKIIYGIAWRVARGHRQREGHGGHWRGSRETLHPEQREQHDPGGPGAVRPERGPRHVLRDVARDRHARPGRGDRRADAAPAGRVGLHDGQRLPLTPFHRSELGRARQAVFLGASALAAIAWISGCGFDGVGTGRADDAGADGVSPPDSPLDLDSGAPRDDGAGGDGTNGSDGGIVRQPTLLLWLDGSDPAGDGTRPADGTPVAAWIDKARGRSVLQPMANRRATFKASGIAGKPSLQFDGIDDFFDVDLDINGVLLPEATVIAVFQNAPGDTSSYSGVWGHDNGGWDRFVASGGSMKQNGVSNGTGFSPITGFTASSIPLVTTIVMRGSAAGQSHAYVNGVLGATFKGSVNPGTTHMSVGNLNGPSTFGNAWSFDGYIAEVLVYGSALGDAERQAIEASLISKYTP
jgi:hypothetical protein